MPQDKTEERGMTEEALRRYFDGKGLSVVPVGVPPLLKFASFAVQSRTTGIITYTTADTEVEAAAKMVMRSAGLAPEPKTGTMEALSVALAGLRHALQHPVKDEL